MSQNENARGRSRIGYVLIVLLVWAAIYLPGLGTLEIKGEEGRRILPAVTMLQTGHYLVPQVGSEPYFRKPPLVNWLVAGSFAILGQRNEWTARIPSALSVLAVALAFVIVARGSLGANGSLIAALVWLTNFGIIEKGRLIEIEALYASLTGLAMICWLSAWQERRSQWITWIVPWIFLGLAFLAKGPVLLVFFYAIVLSVLHRAGELRLLLRPAHFVGLLVMLAIFAAWAVPCLWMMHDQGVAHVWTRQFSGRLSGEDFNLGGWLMNIPRGIGYFLPWVVLLPFVRQERQIANAKSSPSEFDLRLGLFWGIALSFFVVSLIPGSLARYTMPLLAPASWLVATFLTAADFKLPSWLRLNRPASLPVELRWPALVTTLVVVSIALYAFAIMPKLKGNEKIRTVATQINAALPTSDPLYAVDPDYQPFLFYVRDPIRYVDRISDIPTDAKYLLVQPKDEEPALRGTQWEPRRARLILKRKDYRNKEVALIGIDGPRELSR